jgi:hypothetical protein
MSVKLNFSSPFHVAFGGTAALTTWAATGFSTQPTHIGAVVAAGLAGVASHSESSSKPDVQADSHIITPYVNNIEEK